MRSFWRCVPIPFLKKPKWDKEWKKSLFSTKISMPLCESPFCHYVGIYVPPLNCRGCKPIPSTSTSQKKSLSHSIASLAAVVHTLFLVMVHSGGTCTDKVLDKGEKKQKRSCTIAAYRNLPSLRRGFWWLLVGVFHCSTWKRLQVKANLFPVSSNATLTVGHVSSSRLFVQLIANSFLKIF